MHHYEESFWRGYHLDADLKKAVAYGRRVGLERGYPFIWLCVTNKGANKVNDVALESEGVTTAQRTVGYMGDPNASAGRLFIKPGLRIRLTRNLDKSRGFVNGAMATVEPILCVSLCR